jgi:hypothetical protein
MSKRVRSALLLATVAGAATVAGPGWVSATASQRPDGPKPKLRLLTTTQEAALQQEAISVRVRSGGRARVQVRGRVRVQGLERALPFTLGPTTRRFSRPATKRVRFRLDPRERQVLAFAIERCRTARVTVRARNLRDEGSDPTVLSARLRRHDTC